MNQRNKKSMKWDQPQLIDVATRYYLKDQRQKDIAEELGLSTVDVSNCLQIAKHQGIVRFFIDRSLEENLGDRLKQEFSHLQEVRVIVAARHSETVPDSLLQQLAKEGAQYLIKTVEPGESIGVSAGKTLGFIIDEIGTLHLQKAAEFPANCRVYPLMLPEMADIVPLNPLALAVNLIKFLPWSSGRAFQLPSPENDKKQKSGILDVYKEHPEIRAFRADIEKLDYYFTGIAAIDYARTPRIGTKSEALRTFEFNNLAWRYSLIEALKKYKAVGEMVHQPFDREGNILIDEKGFEPLKERLLLLPLKKLHDHAVNDTASVVTVAGGPMRYEPLLAALRGKFFNVLITDSITANYILDAMAKEKIASRPSESSELKRNTPSPSPASRSR